MDELEISGKRYISSRRAGKQYHYHSDYIGQLVRGGKVAGTKVGRAWYVDEASLAAYLGKEAPAPIVRAVAPEIQPQPESVAHAPVPAPIPAPEPKLDQVVRTPAPEPVVIATAHSVPVHAVASRPTEEIVVSISSGDAWEEREKIELDAERSRRVPLQKKTLTYVEDDTLMPEIRSAVTRMPTRPAETERTTPQAASVPAPRPPRSILPAMGLVLAGLAIFSVVALGSSVLMNKVTIEQGKPASVGFSLQE